MHFVHLECVITYAEDKDIYSKTNNYQSLCGTIRRTLKEGTMKGTQIKFYIVLTVPTLLYGSGSWAKKEELKHIKSSEMKFLRW